MGSTGAIRFCRSAAVSRRPMDGGTPSTIRTGTRSPGGLITAEAGRAAAGTRAVSPAAVETQAVGARAVAILRLLPCRSIHPDSVRLPTGAVPIAMRRRRFTAVDGVRKTAHHLS
jgi:hypothetical protein